MAALAKPLLASTPDYAAAVVSRRCRLAATVGSLFVLFFLGTIWIQIIEFGFCPGFMASAVWPRPDLDFPGLPGNRPDGPASSTIFLSGAADPDWSNISVTALQGTAAAISISRSADCFGPTGGTCHLYPCHPERRAVCSGGLCVCDHGCTGVEGACHETRYKRVASKFTLRNVKYPDDRLYVGKGWTNYVRVTDDDISKYAGTFSLYELPGTISGDVNHKKFAMLVPDAYPDLAVNVVVTASMSLGLPGHLLKAQAASLKTEADPRVVTVHVCRAKNYPNAVQIQNSGASIYIHHLSWQAYGWVWADPGPSGYWIPEPPLDGDIPEC